MIHAMRKLRLGRGMQPPNSRTLGTFGESPKMHAIQPDDRGLKPTRN